MKLRTCHVAVCALALFVPHQSRAEAPPVPSPAPVSVRVTQTEPLPRYGNLTQFVSTLVELRLVEEGLIRVTHVAEEPPCEVRRDASGQARPPMTSTPSYVIAIELHKLPNVASTEFVIDYSLTRVELQCQRTELLHRTETFREVDALESLKIVSDVVAVLARTDAVHLPTVELTIASGGATTTERDAITNEVASRILRSLNAQSDLDAKLVSALSGTADYGITVRLELTDGSVRAQFGIDPLSGASVPPLHIDGGQAPGQLDAFYAHLEKSVTDAIDDLRVIRATGLPDRVTVARTEELRRFGLELLCLPDSAPGCVPQPKEAETVLLRLAEEVRSEEAYEWLGVAQTGAGKYAAAGDTFTTAAQKATDNSTRFKLTVQAAAAHYEARKFDNAAIQYASARRISQIPGAPPFSSVPAAYLQWARALRLGTPGSGPAVDVLLQGLADSGVDKEPLINEFVDLVGDLRSDTLRAVVQKIASASPAIQARLMVPTRRAVVRDQLAAVDLAYLKRDFASMDRDLTDVETRFIEVLDKSSHETIARLRGLWIRDGSNDKKQDPVQRYLKAEARFKEALDWDPKSRRAQFALAETYAAWPGDSTSPAVFDRATRASELFEELTTAGYSGAAAAMRDVNNRLKRDNRTRDVLERVTAANPNDRGAILTLMGVCTDDLNAFDCAAAAADRLDVIDRSNPEPDAQLDLVEIEVLAQRYSAARDRLARVMANPQLIDRLKMVGLFYQVWLAYTTTPGITPASLIDSWKTVMGRLQSSRTPTLWVFRGARAALTPGHPAGPASTGAVVQLSRMIDAMDRQVNGGGR